MRDLLARVAGWCVERPVPVLAASVLLALIGAVGALMLEADAGTDQLVDRGFAYEIREVAPDRVHLFIRRPGAARTSPNLPIPGAVAS